MSEPFLIVAALWTDGDEAEAVSKALKPFTEPDGFPRGAAVSFSRATADDPGFRHVMSRLDLAEVNARPGTAVRGGSGAPPESVA